MKLKNSGAEIFRGKDMIFTSEGNLGAKKEPGHYGARSNLPAVAQTRCKWIIGDVTEVLDRNTWKLGKILKMLKDNYFIIRLADCIQLKEFHISSLRIPHAPGAPINRQLPISDKVNRRSKQQSADHGALPRSRAAQKISGKKRKAAAGASHHLSKRAHPRNVATASNLNGAVADSYLHSPSQVRDEAECSVASCSVNDSDHCFNKGNGKLQAAAGFFPNDAMSACPCTSGREEEDEDHDEEPAACMDVHALELEAYRSTMRALYASGPLTWEQESLLTNLRLSLNISNEEHLLQLRRLLSSS